jgi:hypothetical protein
MTVSPPARYYSDAGSADRTAHDWEALHEPRCEQGSVAHRREW